MLLDARLPSDWPPTFESCLRRITRWRTPPNWSRADWVREVRAQAACAVCIATRDFDASRGVPFDAFAHHRILTAVLTRYRQEWAFAGHCAPTAITDSPARQEVDSPTRHAQREIMEYIRRTLPRSDRALLLALFWGDRTEATIGRKLGLTQQAISKRKRTVLRELRRRLS
jgi:DNA-directed RNA polymerase specialized sigma subunit